MTFERHKDSGSIKFFKMIEPSLTKEQENSSDKILSQVIEPIVDSKKSGEISIDEYLNIIDGKGVEKEFTRWGKFKKFKINLGTR